MKKLSELSIADLVALRNLLKDEISLADYYHNGKLVEELSIKTDKVRTELNKRVTEIEDFKDI